ncbi:winged helix-turn-helix transcriptional regulator [Candidatus Bathyarchaeota archaeon]|nr:winged helix-turn-helix transcriptional regulator [Candidatus Bathyarchaeota archaeon]
MSSFDDEVYSVMFNALRHEVRRKILRMLSRRRMSFTSLYEELGISSSHLTYHLDSLGELVSKDESLYGLSRLGEAALGVLTRRNDSAVNSILYDPRSFFKYLSGLLLTLTIMMSVLLGNLYEIQAAQAETIEKQGEEIETLSAELDDYAEASELMRFAQGSPSVRLASLCTLTYQYTKSMAPDDACEGSTLLLYSPRNNMMLHIEYMVNVPNGLYLPLTVQRGNPSMKETGADDAKTETHLPVVWQTNITEPDGTYDFQLPAKGWYVVSLTGPIKTSENGAPTVRSSGWGRPDTWITTESMRAWASCQLLYMREPVLFGLEPGYAFDYSSSW